MIESSVELVRIETEGGQHYSATFKALSPEGDFQVTVYFVAPDESKVFRVARDRFRRMIAHLAAATNDWSLTAAKPFCSPSVDAAE